MAQRAPDRFGGSTERGAAAHCCPFTALAGRLLRVGSESKPGAVARIHPKAVAGQVIEAPAGSFVYGPRDIPHTFEVASEEALFQLVTEPAGFEKFARGRGGRPIGATP